MRGKWVFGYAWGTVYVEMATRLLVYMIDDMILTHPTHKLNRLQEISKCPAKFTALCLSML